MNTTLQKVVEKYNLDINQELMPIEIPNIGRDQLPALFHELGFTVGVEVGVLKGCYAEQFLQANGALKLYAVDPWARTDGFLDFSNRTLEKSYRSARKRLDKYNCEIIRKTSMQALDDFQDESLDFVYLDGDHSFKSVVLDICGWIKKIKVGGIISGHDYRRYVDEHRSHVPQAVVGYTESYNIKPWFVLGRKHTTEPDEIRDKERSWMWIKTK